MLKMPWWAGSQPGEDLQLVGRQQAQRFRIREVDLHPVALMIHTDPGWASFSANGASVQVKLPLSAQVKLDGATLSKSGADCKALLESDLAQTLIERNQLASSRSLLRPGE